MSGVDGAIAWAMEVLEARSAAVVDVATGATLAAAGELANGPEAMSAAGTLVLAGLRITDGLDADPPEDLLVTTGGWFHLIRPVYVGADPVACVHVLLDRARTNLALARRDLAQLAVGDLAAALTAAADPEPPPPRPPAATPDPDDLPAALPRRRPNETWPGGRPVDADLRLVGAGAAVLDQIVREPTAPPDDGVMRRLAAGLRRL